MTDTASPKDVTKGPKGQRSFTWSEPGEWTQVPSQNFSYNSFLVGAYERGATAYMSIVKYEPNARIEPHYHHCDYCSIVVEGWIEVTRKRHDVGSVRVVKAGTVYGPLVAGPEGCTAIEVFATGEPGSPAGAKNTYV